MIDSIAQRAMLLILTLLAGRPDPVGCYMGGHQNTTVHRIDPLLEAELE